MADRLATLGVAARHVGRLLLVSAILLTFFPQALLAQEADGPVFWLKFDETTGATTFADSGSAAANGTCDGGACPTAGATGRIGQAAQFDGVDDRVTAAVNTPEGSYTVATWLRFTGTEWVNWRTLVEFGDDAPWFGVTPSGQLTLYPAIFGGSLPKGQWAHAAYVWNGTQSKLFVNGQAVAVNAVAPPGGGQGLALAVETGGPNPWLGLLDDVRVYNRALSDAEIGQLAAPETGPVVAPPAPPPPAPGVPPSRLFDLTVSIYKPITTPAERQPYEELFRLFADGIYEVTNGAHKIRTVTFYDNGRFADRADIQWIQFEQQPRASTNAYGRGRGTVHMGDAIFSQNTQITDPNDVGTFLNTLTHEWSHYTYGILDEYASDKTSTDPGSPQSGDTPPQPCSVMCAAPPSIDFARLNFSTPKSTAGVGRTNTAHYRTFGASAWETVARPPANDPPATRGTRLYWDDLAPKGPAAGQDPSVELPAARTTARDALNFVWVDANAPTAKHRVFLIDVSADMGQDNKLESAKLAIKNYVDRTNVGDLVGIITFANTHTVVQPLTRIDDDATRTAIKAQIDAIQAEAGVTNRNGAGADAAAITALQQASTNAFIIDRSVYTIIDGAFTDNTEPFIFQKLYNDHNAVGISFSVFNYAATPKQNDLFSNSLELLRFPTTAANPPGTYQFVGNGGFAIPGVAAAAASPVSAGALSSALGAADQQSSPLVDVNLGTARSQTVNPGTPLTANFYVDATLDEVEVAVLFDGSESAADLTLVDPDSLSASELPVCESDGYDTLCTILLSQPAVGTWQLDVAATGSPLTVDYAVTGHTLNGDTYHAAVISQAGAFVTYPEEIVLVAELSRGARIAGAGVTAWAEGPDGAYVDLTLLDDGVAPDVLADDGQYTGFLPYDQPGDYDVTVIFDNIAGAAFYTQAGMADALDPSTSPVGDDFDRFAEIAILVDDYAGDDHGASDSDASDLLGDNSDLPGRIDTAGDVDRFRIASPEALPDLPRDAVFAAAANAATERYILRLTHFAFGMDAIVRVTTSSGTKEYATGQLAYDAYWTLPLDLAPGEVVTVDVLHKNGQSAAGQYDISFGKPLLGESAGATLYLPHVQR